MNYENDKKWQRFKGIQCCCFEGKVTKERLRELKVVKDYGDKYVGEHGSHILYEWDNGGRALLQCPHCGAYFLRQHSEYHGMDNDELYCDWVQVETPEQAEKINALLSGSELHRYKAPQIRMVGDEITVKGVLKMGKTFRGPKADFSGEYDLPLNLHKAIRFAEEKHRQQKRKNTEISYIVHPMEVLQILTMQNSSMEVALAGILHDTLEETRTRPIEIEREFGPEVLRLIQAYMEKKGAGNRQRSWKARKTDRLKRLRSVDKAVKQLAMADTLSNMRTMVYDYYTFGDAFWSRCSASKEELEWYYREKIAIFAEFIDDGQLKSGYWELNNLFNHLFTNYYAEGEEETTGIYRAAKDQITYCPKGTAGDSAEQAVEALPENVQHITKAEAEKIKENWMI